MVLFWAELWGDRPFELLASCALDGRLFIQQGLSQQHARKMSDKDEYLTPTEQHGSRDNKNEKDNAIDMMQWQVQNPYRQPKGQTRREGARHHHDHTVKDGQRLSGGGEEAYADQCYREDSQGNNKCARLDETIASQQNHISRSLVKVLRAFDKSAYWYFAAAAVVHVPWVVSLFFFHDRITYIPTSTY